MNKLVSKLLKMLMSGEAMSQMLECRTLGKHEEHSRDRYCFAGSSGLLDSEPWRSSAHSLGT